MLLLFTSHTNSRRRLPRWVNKVCYVFPSPLTDIWSLTPSFILAAPPVVGSGKPLPYNEHQYTWSLYHKWHIPVQPQLCYKSRERYYNQSMLFISFPSEITPVWNIKVTSIHIKVIIITTGYKEPSVVMGDLEVLLATTASCFLISCHSDELSLLPRSFAHK